MASISSFLDKYNLPWLLLAVFTWLAIIFTSSYRDFLYCLPVGIWTMGTGTLLEKFFILNKFWVERFIMIDVGGIDFFVIIGPFFGLGFMVIRFLPESRLGKFLALLGWSGLAVGIELLSTKLGFLEYHPQKWGSLYSLFTYYFALMSALGFYYVYYNHITRTRLGYW